MYDAFRVHLFCRYKGKTFLKIKSHLVAKTADSSGSRAIMFLGAGIQYMLKEIKVLLHARKLIETDESRVPGQGL